MEEQDEAENNRKTVTDSRIVELTGDDEDIDQTIAQEQQQQQQQQEQQEQAEKTRQEEEQQERDRQEKEEQQRIALEQQQQRDQKRAAAKAKEEEQRRRDQVVAESFALFKQVGHSPPHLPLSVFPTSLACLSLLLSLSLL